MRAAVISGAKSLRVTDLPDPEAGPGQVLIRISHVGVCGSDLSYYKSGAVGAFVVREPLVPGHELSGTVVHDSRDDGLAPGTPVTVHPASPGTELPGLAQRPNIWPQSRYLGSAATLPHQQGAMSELFVADADKVRVLPAELPLARAALAEPLAVALHGIARSGNVAGKRVLVSGAGAIGVLLAMACTIKGAAEVTITDVLPAALARARELGVAKGIVVGQQDIDTESYDVVFEASGSPAALLAAINAVVRGGTMIQLGLLPQGPQPVDVAALVTREIDYLGSFRFHEELDEAIDMLAQHPEFDGVVTHQFELDDVVAAFDCAVDAAQSLKVLVALG